MRVVLDTNVIIAAFATRGLCQDIFQFCLQEKNIIASEPLLEEVRRVLLEKIQLPASKVESILELLVEQTEITKPTALKSNICRDPDDIKILATAQSGKADIIVTGDEDLLVLKKFDNILIVSPREFWKFLTRKNK